ncbi:MAG: phenylacetate--CoA ligase [Planctomycetia bacterium]|nr:phenylacetate--CoA ligase [Planctomycetia bacterium]
MPLNEKEYFNPREETMSVDELRSVQNERVKSVVRYAVDRNAYMKSYYAKEGIDVNAFRGLDDLPSLPFVSKSTFRETYPMGLMCVAKEEIREMHMSSGSTGMPIVMPYTQGDLDQWAECMARCYRMAGGLPGDVVQITPSFGLFNGGFGMYHGARAAEMFIVPASSGNTERQIRLINDFQTKILTAVISYCVRIIEIADRLGVKLPSLKTGVFGAEAVTDAMKQQIHDALGIEVFNIYGMTETGGVGTLGMDCGDHSGIHVWEDHYYVEVVDPQTLTPVPDGELGELVITSLTREAIPVIRLRTGDLTRIISRKPCACGRTHVKIDSISGRTDDMLIIKGVNFFPTQVEQALLEIPGVHPHYQIIIEDHHGVKDIRIHVEAEDGVTGFMVEKHLKERLGFSPKGDIFKPGSLPRNEGKAVRVVRKEVD